jgi:tetratricopeptide (TPR) repeat protein
VRTRPGTGTTLFAAAATALYLASPLLSARLNPTRYVGGRARDIRQREIRNTSSVAIMLGEVRTAMSDIMYIKTERYLDHGIAYMPHLRKTLSISGQATAIDEHQAEVAEQTDHEAGETGEEHEHAEDADTPTMVPTRTEDFRGFIGDLERSVKPWRDPSQPHAHSDGTELLPWFRLMTLSDPHYVLGYTVGGWWLKSRNLDEALKFAQEGIDKNPDSFQVWYTMGQLLLEKGRRAAGGRYLGTEQPEALAILRETRQYYQHAAELVLKQRPANAMELPDDPRWGDHMEEDARAACRMAVLAEFHYGDRTNAVGLARRYMQVLGRDILLERIAAREDAPGTP